MASITFDTQELISSLTRAQISKLPQSTLSSLTDEQITWFTPIQITWFNKAQIDAIRVNNFTLEQLKNLTVHISYFNSLNGFTKEKIESLNLTQIKFLTPSTISNTDSSVHKLFQGPQLEAMPVLSFKEIKHNILSLDQISHVNRNLSILESLDLLTEEQVKSLTQKQMKYITTKCLSNSNAKNLLANQLNIMSNVQFLALKITDIQVEEIKLLNRPLSFLPSLSLLNKDQIQALSKSQLNLITVKALDSSDSSLGLLTKSQLNDLTLQQQIIVIQKNPSLLVLLDVIQPKLVPTIPIKLLPVEGFNHLQQLDKFNVLVDKYAEIQKRTFIRYLTNQQLSELTEEHMKSLNVGVLNLKQIPLIDITKLSYQQLGFFSNETRGGMSESQLLYYMDNYWNVDHVAMEMAQLNAEQNTKQ